MNKVLFGLRWVPVLWGVFSRDGLMERERVLSWLTMGWVYLASAASVVAGDSAFPTLSLTRSNETVAAAWWVSPFPFALEKSGSLGASADWTEVSDPASTLGEENHVEVPRGSDSEFFRLKNPSWPPGQSSPRIPLFQFAIFYGVDLELGFGKDMSISGPVHCNWNVYATPNGSVLTFQERITAAGSINHTNSPYDTIVRLPGEIVYSGGHRSGSVRLELPLGTNNSPENVIRILEPAGSEGRDSLLGRQKYYNKADVIIEVTGTSASPVVNARIGYGVDGIGTSAIPSAEFASFLNTTKSFFNGREDVSVKVIDIDVSKFNAWATSWTNSASHYIKTTTGHYPNSIYVVDKRILGIGRQPGVRLINGARLPPDGLTVATPAPLYVQGDFNTTKDGVNFSKTAGDTTNTRPASLCADAITILSTAWKDSENSGGPGTTPPLKQAGNTTVNAAMLAGICQTKPLAGKNGYSGGVENFPRLLEDWGGITLTFNGSIAVPFFSRIAIGTWAGKSYYGVPMRSWAFDRNFLYVFKLPPCTPMVEAPGSVD